MNVQLFPADCLQPCGGSDCGSVVRKTDCMASVTTWTMGRKTSMLGGSLVKINST